MTINKSYTIAEKNEMRDDERSIVCYASVNEVDRHGEMILPSAWTEKGLLNYRKNPVILVNHDYHSLPVAKSIWQKVDSNGLKFKIKFADSEAGKELYSLYSNGYMSSFSVGFRPVKIYDNEAKQKYKDKNGNIPHTVYEECELLELSCVTIPAAPSANIIRNMKSFIDSYKSGAFKSEEVKSIAEQIKASPEYIELISNEQDEPTEEKAKKIGFIELEEEKAEAIEEKDKCESCENEDCECEIEKKDVEVPVEKEVEEPMIEEKELEDDVKEVEEVVEKTIEETISERLKMAIDELKNYIDKNIEEKLKFFNENADKESIEEKQEGSLQDDLKELISLMKGKLVANEKVNPEEIELELIEKTVEDIELEEPQQIELDLTADEIKKLISTSVRETYKSASSISELVEERIKKAKGIIF